jgi:PAS domain S-box-containing protein
VFAAAYLAAWSYLFVAAFLGAHPPPAPLFPPAAVLVSALLLAPPRRWWVYLIAAFVIQVPILAYLHVPLWWNVLGFTPDAIEPLVAASLMRRFIRLPPRFASLREVTRYTTCVVVSVALAATLGSVVNATQGGEPYGTAWLTWFLSDTLALLVLAPTLLLWSAAGLRGLRAGSPRRYAEAGALYGGLVVLLLVVFNTRVLYQDTADVLIYLPVPLLLWAAIRFGPRGIASALSLLAILAVPAVANALGPFASHSSPSDAILTNVFTLQVFLLVIGVPLLFLATLYRERERAETVLETSEVRYRSVVETQTELVTRYLPDTTITFVNEANCRSLGKSREEVIGTRLLEYMPAAARERVQAAIQSLLEHPGIATIEHETLLPDGTIGWQQWVNRTMLDREGRVVELQGIGRDITERKRLEGEREAARVEAERRAAQLEATFEAMADGLAVFDARGHLVQENAAQRRLLGLDAEPPGYAELSLPERLALFAARDGEGRPLGPDEGPLPRALRGEVLSGAETMDMRSRTLDGREIELSVSAAPLRDPDGRLTGAVAIFHDQTERKQAQEALRASEALFRTAFESAAVGMMLVDPAGHILQVNRPLATMLGYSEEELRGRTFMDHTYPDDLEPNLTLLRRAVAGEIDTYQLEKRFLHKDGHLVWGRVSAGVVCDATGQPCYLVGQVEDIGERKQLAQALAEQAAQMDRIFEQMTEPLALHDAAGRIVRVNAAMRLLMVPNRVLAEYGELPLGERVALFAVRDAEDRSLAPEGTPLMRALRGEELTGENALDMRLRSLDGREVELRVSVAPLRDADGRIAGTVSLGVDVTERNQLARALAEQAEQLNRTFEGMADGVVVYDTEGRWVRTNAAARRLLGLDTASPEFIALPPKDRAALYTPRDGQQSHQQTPQEWLVTRALRGDVQAEAETRDIRMRALDGRELEISASVASLRDDRGQVTGAVLLLHDRTERNQLAREREEAHASALAERETARQMSDFLSLIGHELRNPLTSLKGQIQLAERQLKRVQASQDTVPDTIAEMLGHLRSPVWQLERLISDLVEAAQLQQGQFTLAMRPCDLAQVVREAVEAQRAAWPERAVVLQVPEGEEVVVLADAERVRQVVTNYLTNALKYTPPEGPIAITLGVEAGQARLSVRDQGPGIPLEEQSQIWEQFRRGRGADARSGATEGLGLGLYLCKQLIERQGGEVGLESEIGAGSTFWFCLPLAGAPG